MYVMTGNETKERGRREFLRDMNMQKQDFYVYHNE